MGSTMTTSKYLYVESCERDQDRRMTYTDTIPKVLSNRANGAEQPG